MEIAAPFDEEVMGYKKSSFDDTKIVKLRSLRDISSMRNEEDVVMEV